MSVINLTTAKALGLLVASTGGSGDRVIDRRTFLAGTGAMVLAAPLAAEGQPAAKVP